MGCAVALLLCSGVNNAPAIMPADIVATKPFTDSSLGITDFDLRANGFSLRQAGLYSPLLRQFSQAMQAERRSVAAPAHVPQGLIAVLSAAEAAAYRNVFGQLEQGNYTTAAAAAEKLNNPLLLGHVLSARLLAKNYHAAYDELTQWLERYRDHPMADKIYALAVQRRPRDAKAPPSPVTSAAFRGSLDETDRELTAQIQVDTGTSPEARETAQEINALLRQGHAEDAVQLLQLAKDDPAFPSVWQAEGQAAVAAIRFYSEEAEPTRDLTDAMVAEAPLGAWIAGLLAWRQADYARASAMFAAMTAQEAKLSAADRAAGYYWQARALYKTGDRTAAKAVWRKAADFDRCFYGQLARAKLGMPTEYLWEAPRLTKEAVASIIAHPAGKRGLALLQIGMNAAAEAELRRIPLRGEMERAFALLALAEEARLPALAMQLGSFLKTGAGRPLDSALYPVPPWQSDKAETDEALVYAVMRHESGFDPALVSRAGARGLMQIMPQTARYIETGSETQLADPVRNVNLGSRYLRYLAEQPMITNNALMVLAAYNGGPGNLARWRQAAEHGDDPLLLIESLPVRETRHYVQNVLSSYWVYQARMGVKQTTLQQLAAGQWPKLPASPAAPIIRAEAEPMVRLASR